MAYAHITLLQAPHVNIAALTKDGFIKLTPVIGQPQPTPQGLEYLVNVAVHGQSVDQMMQEVDGLAKHSPVKGFVFADESCTGE